jgi:hypothetical protein
MNNLSTYEGYTLLFDSEVVPEQHCSAGDAAPSAALVDLACLPSFKSLAEQQLHSGTGIEALEELLGTGAADEEAAQQEAAALVQEAFQSRVRAPAAPAAGSVKIYRAGARRTAAGAAAPGGGGLAAEGAAEGQDGVEDDQYMEAGGYDDDDEPSAGQVGGAGDGAPMGGEGEEDGMALGDEVVLEDAAAEEVEPYQVPVEASAAGYDAVAEFEASLQAELQETAEEAGDAAWEAGGDDSDGEQPSEGPQQQPGAKVRASRAACTPGIELHAPTCSLYHC